MRVLDFKDHRRELGENRYVYAVASRRSQGLSIGVNLNPDKVCNFACPYCQVDRTTPGGPPEIDLVRLGDELEALLVLVASGDLWTVPPFDSTASHLRRVADIAFSGDGEPTTPAAFPEAAQGAKDVRDRLGVSVPLRLITNATMFDRPRVREALALFDELWCKLDAGSAAYFARVDGTRFSFERVLRNLTDVARERPIVIQSLFPTMGGTGPTSEEIAAYLGRLSDIVEAGGQIAEVQVYTVARPPADPGVGALAAARLEEIAAAVRARRVPARAFV